MVFAKDLVSMFLRINLIIIVLACVVIGVTPQLSWGESHYRLAKAYADKNDAERASAYYGLALRSAAPSQVAGIASDYAAFLMGAGDDLHKAELMLRQALTQSPHDEQLKKTLARCLVLQDKVIEGMRYYKSVGSEIEAKEEIMAIYRERGNSEMVVAIEKKWGEPKSEPTRTEPVHSKPVYVAAIPKPVFPSEKAAAPSPVVEERPNPLPAPMLSAPTVIAQKPLTPKPVAPKPFVASITPSEPLSKSELFDTKIPIPVPRTAPVTFAKNTPKPVAPVPPPLPAPKYRVETKKWAKSTPNKLPADMLSVEIQPKSEKRTFAQANFAKLSAAPQSSLSSRYTSTSVVAPRPRKHYIINTSASTDLDALFPVKPVSATMEQSRNR